MPQQIRTTFSLHYTGGTLDRATEKRGDTDWIAERLTHSSSLIAPVWRNRNLIHHHDEPTAVLTVGNDAQKFLELAEDIVLLGIEQENGNTIFAADLSHHDDEAIAPLTNGASFLDLREIGPMMSREEANLLAFARGVMFWHRRQKYCGICGHPTESRNAGHMRQCTNPECGREHYPRTDPAVIMLVTRDTPNGEVCLLAHKAAMPEGRFSVLAGYVDPGESLEEAVAREVKEETGVIVSDVQYRASQPWPFPCSLMLGFRARAISEEITCDDVEIAEAYWFSRDDLKHFPEKGYQLSRPDSIARCLIDEWLNEGD
jgi:NAD+ diphosphatase